MLTIVPTIDTEGVHGQRPFRQMVLGEIEGSSEDWGVYRLADVFARHGAPATFFVDVYELSLWGEDVLRDVCVRLNDRGFDVQLHTHPAWRDDPHDFDWLRQLKQQKSYLAQEKDFMVKLARDEQVQLLRQGMDFLESWTGKRPVAHRSGGYSINEDTIEALRLAGIQLDSSMHWGHAHSQVAWSRNAVVERAGLLEIPVTLIDYVFSLPGAGTLYRKSMKTDIDTCSLEELLAYVEQARELGLTVMNLFMHSYSLLRFDADYRHFRPEPADEAKLDGFFAAVRRMDGVRIMDCAGLLERYRQAPAEFSGPDRVPEIRVNAKIARLAMSKAWNMGHEAMRRRVRVGN
jgi:peptidoglycan/xylan/chitin deacetylase (PgdA/CDA1 family)